MDEQEQESERNEHQPNNQPNNWDVREPYDSDEWDEEEESDYSEEGNGSFDKTYTCYPLSAIDKLTLENGGKDSLLPVVIMPFSALPLLACFEISSPMLFELRNPANGKVTHCGVQEFTADWGNIHIPKLMMENMQLQEGNSVKVRSIQIPKGTYVKLQPHTKDFLKMANPKVILEFSLRDHFCLTTGDTIMIAYNNKQYYIDIVETKPSHAVSMIDTDCEVDFVKPLDYEEPEKQLLPEKECSEVHEDSAKKSVKINPFSGTARRLDGKACTQSVPETSSSVTNQQQTENATKYSNFKTPASRKTSGKLVFGSNVNVPRVETSTKKHEESQKKEEPKFQAFTGKKYSLMD
ncbi:hypothetical protein ACSQ67_025266 [Phaseolus vulgaris]